MATGEDKTCGPGYQNQKRECKDGTIDICEPEDMNRKITCEQADTTLPPCQGPITTPSSGNLNMFLSKNEG